MKINELVEAAEPIYYLAYGMLTDPSLMFGAVKVGAAEVRNFQFELLQFANLHWTPGANCKGALWTVTRDMLAYLDKIEGYPILYDRKTIPVYVNGQKYVAEVYTLTPESRNDLEYTVPNKSYIKKLIKGYRHFGLPIEQISQALDIAIHNKTEYEKPSTPPVPVTEMDLFNLHSNPEELDNYDKKELIPAVIWNKIVKRYEQEVMFGSRSREEAFVALIDNLGEYEEVWNSDPTIADKYEQFLSWVNNPVYRKAFTRSAAEQLL
jgi:Gamma-glutamyl cyclotransferase, AIG2-like